VTRVRVIDSLGSQVINVMGYKNLVRAGAGGNRRGSLKCAAVTVRRSEARGLAMWIAERALTGLREAVERRPVTLRALATIVTDVLGR
jgi:hypothetical protein